MSKKATLYRLVTDKHMCPYGIKAKDLLKSKGYELEDNHLKNKAEADELKVRFNVSTTPLIFMDDKKIGGYTDVREYLGFKDKKVSYWPVLSIFVIAALLVLAFNPVWSIIFSMRFLELFVGVSMTLLALQKIRDLYAFSLQFLSYDLLAQKWVKYAVIYPFAEALVGLGMIAKILLPFVIAIAFIIGLIGTVSVIKAVYIDKRELKCACVGGNSNVPLGALSLTENLMMVFMSAWMFYQLV